MQQRRVKVVTFDTARLEQDMADRGWMATDLARRAKAGEASVSRFLRGQQQTARMLARLAKALGFSPRRYITRVSKDAAA